MTTAEAARIEELERVVADRDQQIADMRRELDEGEHECFHDEDAAYADGKADGLGAVALSNEMTHAVHMLHEQAHGQVPFTTCMEEPCRSLNLPPNAATQPELEGPAPLSLPLPGEDH